MLFSGDRFAWLRDNEFGRQALAGVNPVNIELLKVCFILPFESKIFYEEFLKLLKCFDRSCQFEAILTRLYMDLKNLFSQKKS